MRLIDADVLKEALNTYDTFACLPNGKLYPIRDLEHPEMFVTYIHVEDVFKAIDNAPIVENKIIELFKRYDVLVVPINGQNVPVKNTTKQECYDLLFEIQELINWRKMI